jgi:hypothetical protein
MVMIPGLYYINMLSWLFKVLVYWNNSPRIDMSRHSDTPNSETTSICCFPSSCMSKYQLYGIWFDLTCARNLDLPHLRWARFTLHERWGLIFFPRTNQGINLTNESTNQDIHITKLDITMICCVIYVISV